MTDRSLARRPRRPSPARDAKILTTGLAATMLFGLVAMMGRERADEEPDPPRLAIVPAPSAVGAGPDPQAEPVVTDDVVVPVPVPAPERTRVAANGSTRQS